MESEGVGVHIPMSAKTALELGCPIRGILSFTSTLAHTCLSGHLLLSVTDSLVATKLTVPFLPMVATRLASHVKSSPNIDLRSLITERGTGSPQKQGRICGSRFLCKPHR